MNDSGHVEPEPLEALRPQLRDCAGRAVNWLAEQVTSFDPIGECTEFDLPCGKALAELSFFAGLAVDYFEFRDLPLAPILDEAERVQANRHYRHIARRSPELVLLYATTHTGLKLAGREDRSMHELLQKIVDQGYVTAIERPAFRFMDLQYTLTLAGLKHDLLPLAQYFEQTIVHRVRASYLLSLSDVYAITHALFYMTDFGRAPHALDPYRDDIPLGRLIGDLVGTYARESNWDICAELIICAECAGLPPDPVYEGAWRALLRAQRPSGSVPGPRSKSTKPATTHPRSTEEDVVTDYHTTVVVALACLVTLKRLGGSRHTESGAGDDG